MKSIITTLLLISIFIVNGFSTTFIVNVGQGGGLTFSPSSITNAVVGDSVKFVWVSGTHTTTSTSVPAGAATWDSPITSSFTTYIYRITVAGTYNYKCTPHAAMGMVGSFIASASGIENTGEVVKGYTLFQNYPNPFNPATIIKFSIPQNSFVTMNVYDVSGKEITTLVNNQLQEGTYKFTLDGASLSSGVYFYKINAGSYTEIKRMVLLK